jgi:hypothetical protein
VKAERETDLGEIFAMGFFVGHFCKRITIYALFLEQYIGEE